jgi:ACS family glucarate transporter-like MFS transporter
LYLEDYLNYHSKGSFTLAIVFGKMVDLTHNFNAPLFVVAGVLWVGGLIWLVVDPVSKIEIVRDKQMLHSAA